MHHYQDNDVVKVKFNFAAYVSDEENPFDVNKLYTQNNIAKGDMECSAKLNTKHTVHAGQVVEMYWNMAKKYVDQKTVNEKGLVSTSHKPCFFHKEGLGVSYGKDPNWVREISIAEVVG